MSPMRFADGHVVVPAGVLAGATIAVEHGRIAAIDAAGASADGETIDLEGGWLMPGFIDTQVNGGGGVLFNTATDVDGIRAIGAAHLAFGTTGFLPTLISDDLDRVAAALAAAEDAIAAGVPGVVGVHIEGPFLNPDRRGIHDPAKFRRIDAEMIGLLARPRRAKVLLTLAPELCTVDEIAALAAGGVIVSAGHSDADHATIAAALAAGMTGFTHLFNAMSPLHHRAPGVVGAALDDQQAYCGLIADGVHVDPVVLRIACRARPVDRMMLVTDAMPSVGAATKDFVLQGKPIRGGDGICVDAEGTLAGSDLDMARAVRNMIGMVGIDPSAAAAMAATVPAAFLGLSHERGRLAPGLRADWVWLDAEFRPRGTWIAGQRVA